MKIIIKKYNQLIFPPKNHYSMKCFTKISFYLSLKWVKFSLLVLLTGLFIASTFILQSCDKNPLTPPSETVIVSKNSDNEYFADMDLGDSKFTYFTQTNTLKSSGSSSSAIQSNFQVKKDNVVIYNTTFELDTTIRDYRLLQHKKIEQIAKSLNNSLTTDDYVFISTNIETFINGIVKTQSFNKNILQSLFFHMAIANAKKRQMQTGVLECVPDPFYIVGKSFYSDIKDINVSKQTMQEVLRSHPELDKLKGTTVLNAFLNNNKGDAISFDKLYFLSVGKQSYLQYLDSILNKDNILNKTDLNSKQKSIRTFNEKQSVALTQCGEREGCILCGSDWGCCDNYAGCCVIANAFCYWHDVACIQCNSILCGWNCVPG